MPKLKHSNETFWVIFKHCEFCEFLKTWSLRSNSVTRHVNFNRTKIGGKCQNSKILMRHFGWFSNTVRALQNSQCCIFSCIDFLLESWETWEEEEESSSLVKCRRKAFSKYTYFMVRLVLCLQDLFFGMICVEEGGALEHVMYFFRTCLSTSKLPNLLHNVS